MRGHALAGNRLGHALPFLADAGAELEVCALAYLTAPTDATLRTCQIATESFCGALAAGIASVDELLAGT